MHPDFVEAVIWSFEP